MSNKSLKKKKSITYKESGVDVEAGYEFVKKIKKEVLKTKRPEIVSELGAFSAISKIPKNFKKPLLVTSTDGVGTKIEIAKQLRSYDSIGIDLVAMCVNDLITCGAEPLLFLDYFVTDNLNVKVAVEVVKGIADGCKLANCSLVGGETAEHPDSFPKGSFDLAGFALGIVEEKNLIKAKEANENDILIGLPSSGVHSNGFSLIRKIIKDKNISLSKKINGVGLGKRLLTPTTIYSSIIFKLLKKIKLTSIVNITGGGFFENIPRILKDNLMAEINLNRDDWPNSDLFAWIQSEANLSNQEMLSTFNCGIGMIISVKPEDIKVVLKTLKKENQQAKVIGKLKKKRRNNPPITFV